MKQLVLLTGMLISLTLAIQAQKSEVFIKDNAAIRGYDPVAYFTAGKPVKGQKQYSVNYNGADWYFSSKENAGVFKADPEKYLPQYGGYCAYGLAGGHKAPTEPDAWSIVNGKLYLNYDKEVQGLWKKDQSGFIQAADKKWLVLKNKE